MPIYMDVHPGLGDATADDVAEAHRRDLEIAGDFGVRFLSWWFSDPSGKAFCLVDAPDEETLVQAHKKAHGLVPHEVIEVDPPSLAAWMGGMQNDERDMATIDGHADTGLRAIMFTDIEGSTDISTRFGDEAAVEIVRLHDEVVTAALDACAGRQIKHTGDGVLACFNSVAKAVEAAGEIVRRSQAIDRDGPSLAIKVGISAGEPVEGAQDIYGASVNLAARICDQASGGQVLVSSTVRELSLGKAHVFNQFGEVTLKGFPDPIPLFEVALD